MTQQVCHAVVTLPVTDALMDNTTFGITMEATGSDTNLDFSTSQTPQAVIEAFLNSTVGAQTHALNYYLSPIISRAANACSITWTDVTGHLDGTPAGSPFREDFFTLGGSGSGPLVSPAGAVCVAIRGDYGSTVEHGPMVSIPSTDDAIDQGAPPTHLGQERPRSRLRNRFYLGPLLQGFTMAGTGAAFSTAFTSDVAIATNGLIDTHNTVSANQFNVVCWSRRGASVNPATFYYVNEAPAYQRRRADVTAARVHNWVARV